MNKQILADREDYKEYLKLVGVDDKTYRQVMFHAPVNKTWGAGLIEIRKSKRQGKGVFPSVNLKSGTEFLAGTKTVLAPIQKYINHSTNPNSVMRYHDGFFYIQLTQDLTPKDEIVIDYKDVHLVQIKSLKENNV